MSDRMETGATGGPPDAVPAQTGPAAVPPDPAPVRNAAPDPGPVWTTPDADVPGGSPVRTGPLRPPPRLRPPDHQTPAWPPGMPPGMPSGAPAATRYPGPGASPYPPPAASSYPGPGASPYPRPAPAWEPDARAPAWLAGPTADAAMVPAMRRPTYREPLPVRKGRVAAAAGITALWMALVGLLAGTVRAYGWFTIVAALVAWGTALSLARYGDRGAAAGAAVAGSLGLAVATLIVIARWAGGDWPLW